MTWIRILLALACWALLWPGLASTAQDASNPGEMAAQTVAHGLMAMPSETMVWQSEPGRAPEATLAAAVTQPGGFLLADSGALAITDADGKVLEHLAPGQATWISPGEVRAVAGVGGGTPGYLRISLIPAAFIPDEPGAASYGDPFPAPAGLVEIELLRDILERGEELVVSSGEAPALLQVTRGKIFVSLETGAIEEVAAGSPLQFEGAVTISGASRAPAAFVIARLASRVPARIELHDPRATPLASPVALPMASPVVDAERANLTVEAWLCPPGYDEFAPLLACVTPAAGVRFAAEVEDKMVSAFADGDGNAGFPELPAGPVSIRASLPDGAVTTAASCSNVRGDPLGRMRDDALRLMLHPGASVTCSWFIEVGETWPADTFSVTVLTCPPGMVASALHPEFCLPTDADAALQLSVEGAVVAPAQAVEGHWVWGPLLERSYDLTITNIPAGFTGAVLDDGLRTEEVQEGQAAHVDLDDEFVEPFALYLLQPLDESSADIDSDADRLTDAQEVATGTDPFLADSDDDGLPDGDEVGFFGTDPLVADTDGDGLGDQEEVAIYFTNPFLADTDGDGVDDADEIAAQTDPLDHLSLPPTATPRPTATPTRTPRPSASPEATPAITSGTDAGSPVALVLTHARGPIQSLWIPSATE